jgi:hypothetical protein
VSHALLRGENRFSEPLDFMVYLHLYTYSYGFGRREADMSQAQLERFTGAAKNTIKRSLERLTTQGGIKCIQEFECSRTSRKWRVTAPEDKPGKPGSKGNRTVAKLDTITREQCPLGTEGPSNLDTRTVSKIDPYIERDPKEKSKNSLSEGPPEGLREYFEMLKPFSKKESERKAFQELRLEYTDEQITVCVAHLVQHGVPGSGEACHSPMGFLSKAIGQVLNVVQSTAKREISVVARHRAEQAAAESLRVAEEAIDHELQAREEAFAKAFPDDEARAKAIQRFGMAMPMLAPGGPLMRRLAINAWWEQRAG